MLQIQDLPTHKRTSVPRPPMVGAIRGINSSIMQSKQPACAMVSDYLLTLSSVARACGLVPRYVLAAAAAVSVEGGALYNNGPACGNLGGAIFYSKNGSRLGRGRFPKHCGEPLWLPPLPGGVSYACVTTVVFLIGFHVLRRDSLCWKARSGGDARCGI